MPRPKSLRPLFYIFLSFRALSASDYAGANACRACHPTEYAAQSASAHAHSLAPSKPPQPGEWAFGAGSQAITFVHQRDAATYVELGQSWYSRMKAFAATPGHLNGEDTTYPTFDPSAGILRCFSCHSTGPLALGTNQTIVPHELGVRCEACHGPSADHARDPDHYAAMNPGRYTAEAINELCGECHRMPAGVTETTDLRDPWNARHQPLLLAASACFRASNGRLSCLTCHSPHEPVDRNAREYNTRCQTCHARPNHRQAVTGKACAECHMPAVRPQPGLVFANHRIATYAPGHPLTPLN